MSWDEVRARRSLDERAMDAFGRMMGAETILYKLWEQRATGMNWQGEVLSEPICEEDELLYIAALGEKVAALGGHLELVAAFPDKTITLAIEPGSPSASETAG